MQHDFVRTTDSHTGLNTGKTLSMKEVVEVEDTGLNCTGKTALKEEVEETALPDLTSSDGRPFLAAVRGFFAGAPVGVECLRLRDLHTTFFS